jgi:asparagine synthase (glutamine-hydrolysing)
LWSSIDSTPRPLRKLLSAAIRARSPEGWTRTLKAVQGVVPRQWRGDQMGHRLHKLAETMATSSSEHIYLHLMSHWKQPAEVLVDGTEPPSQLTQLMSEPRVRGFEEDMMFWDFLTYLPGDILTKVDRAGMAVSLESRVPLLDHRVIEFAWTLPLHMRRRDGNGKWILKQLLARHVPRQLTDRPKVGFGIPIDVWLRGPLRDWAESLLDESRLRREGFFEPAPIRQKWREHLAGGSNWAYLLWDVLMFQAWWEEQTRSISTATERFDLPDQNIGRAASDR